MPHIGPPKDIFPYVIDFANSVTAKDRPIFLQVSAGTNDIIRECVKNVESHIKEFGGKQIFGWKIWEWYGIMIEAEFHTVWCSPVGTLKDVTPNDPNIQQILFLPDTDLKYENRQIDNIRKSLNEDKNTLAYIKAHESLFEFMNRGERALIHGEMEFSKEEMNEYINLQLNISKLGMLLDNSIPKRNDLCRCGSGKKAKKCCLS